MARNQLREGCRHLEGNVFARGAKIVYGTATSGKTCNTERAEHREERPSRRG